MKHFDKIKHIILGLFRPEKQTEISVEPERIISQPKLCPKPEQKPEPDIKEPRQPKSTSEEKWSISDFEVAPAADKTRFHDFDLPENVMHAIADLKFEYCTPIQAQLLGQTIKGIDGTAKAQTGTGKSASFILTILARFISDPPGKDHRKGSPRALILEPTRELASQIEKDFNDLAKYTGIRILSLFGGMGYKEQQVSLKDHYIDVIVATPGRLIDFMDQKKIFLNKIQILVLDEADRMLDMGFIPDVRKIVYATPHKDKRQTLFFSATLSDEVLRLAKSWTKEDAVMVEVEPEQTTAKNISQKIYLTTETDKFKNVYNLIFSEDLKRVLLFVNRKDTAKVVAGKLKRYGIRSDILSGDVSQKNRFSVLEAFKKGTITVLVATDVAARGLHIENISHVVNYDLPYEPEHYIHRIGRTGRAGAKGISISFADETSSFYVADIEGVLGHKLECEYPPEALCEPLPKPLKPFVHPQPFKRKIYPKKGKYRKPPPKKNIQ